MPQPRPNESKDDFMERCMTQLVGEENRPRDQAFAMCNSLWNDKKEIKEKDENRNNRK